MTDRSFVHACRAARADGFTLPGAEPSYAPDLSLEPAHVEVRLHVRIEEDTAEGSVTTTVRANREGARSLRLDALAFDAVDVVSNPQPVAWSYDGKTIEITWDKPFAAGEERAAEVRYRVVRPVSGMHFSHPDEHYPDRPFFVMTDHETERARHWLPCVDYPSVRAPLDFHLTAARELTILANGLLQEEKENDDGTKTAHWRLEQPCPSYLCCFAIGRFSRFDDEPVDERPLAYFGEERFTPEQLERTFGRTPAMMRWLSGRLQRPFPYPKYFQIALPGIGGAMENISLVTWDSVFVLDEGLAREWDYYVDAVNIHEMAHSYFGDDVVCRHFEHSWLKESWATYIETVWHTETRGEDEGDLDLYLNAKRYITEADERYIRPIVTRTFNSSWDLFDAHLYPGGAWRLHMLRHLVGEEAFWAATTDYLESYSGKVVETDDFRRKLEAHAGLNLTRFFDQWIYGKGYPSLKATFKHDAEKNEATFTIEQTQADEKKGIGLFAFPLEVDYEDDDGWHTVTIDVEQSRHTVLAKVKGKPKQVRFDPRLKALFKLDCNPGDDLLKRTLVEAEQICGRIWAACELVKTGKRANLQAVDEAMKNEAFWGVRAAVAEELGGSGAAEAIEPLAAMLGREEDPRARRSIAMVCGKMRDPRLRDALRGFLEHDPLPWARARALEALGAQRREEDFELLAQETERSDLHRLSAGGALRGLGGLRSRRALEALRQKLAYGAEPDETQHVAVGSFAACAMRLDRETKDDAAEQLADLTRDPRERVRLAAGAGLAALGRPQSVSALESLKPAHTREEWTRINRWIAALKKGAPGEDVGKLREQVEKLEERCRKLDERVQDLEARK